MTIQDKRAENDAHVAGMLRSHNESFDSVAGSIGNINQTTKNLLELHNMNERRLNSQFGVLLTLAIVVVAEAVAIVVLAVLP